jgi:outer membrane protein TolC
MKAWLTMIAVLAGAARAEAGPGSVGVASTDLLPPDSQRASYVQEALANNLALKQKRISVEEAMAVVAQARAQFFPTLTFDARASRRYGAVLDLGQLVNPAYASLNQLLGQQAFPTDVHVALPFERETKVVATQPVFAPALIFQNRLRRHERQAELAHWQAFARQLRAEVQTAYFQYGRALELVGLLARTQVLLEENLRVTQLLRDTGKVTEDAVLRARAEVSELSLRRNEAADGQDAARRYLNFLVNRDLDAEAPTTIPVASPSAMPISKEAAEQNGNAREELSALAAGQRAAGAATGLAKSNYWPTLALAAEYGFQGDTYDFSSDRDYLIVSAVLRWNLWNGLGDWSKARQAELNGQRLATQEQELRRQIALQIRQAWRAAETARRAIDSAADRVRSVRGSYEIVSRRYANGAVPPVELLDARTALTRAEVDQVFARYELAIKLVELERVAALAPEVTP